MAELRNSQNGCGRESVCVDVNRILDSCRDKDCFTDVRVYLSDCAQDVIEHASGVRIKNASVRYVGITVEPVQFNCGFYTVRLRYYLHLCAEACICPGRTQDISGVAVADKRVVLYGGEGSVSIFRSTPGQDNSCICQPTDMDEGETNLPVAVVEVADPVILDSKIVTDCPAKCCCRAEDIPECICRLLGGNICCTDDDAKHLAVTFGLFSVIRMERPDQFVVSASDFSIPDKVCAPASDADPCALFSAMPFPANEFSPPSLRQSQSGSCCGS